MSVNLGVNGNKHYYAVGDETRCPQCFSNTKVKIGVITLSNGVQQDTHKCTSCNTITSTTDGGIKSLVHEASGGASGGSGGLQAGFVSSSSVVGGAINATVTNGAGYANSAGYGYASNGSHQLALDYNSTSKFDNINNNITLTNSNLMMLVNEFKILSNVVKDLAQQNKDLMEKLATDPLNGMRKAVNSFNLE